MNTIKQAIAQQYTTLQQQLSANAATLPSQTSAWQTVLQEAYNSFTPSVTDFASAIYSVWLNSTTVANSITYTQLTNGLLGIVGSNHDPIFTANVVIPAANAYYMNVTINVDTVGILGTSPQAAPTITWVNSYIAMSDNHPSTDSYSGGDQYELDDQGLTPNMTICWTPVADNSTTSVTLTQFFQPSGCPQNWNLLASTPIAVGQSWISIANASLPANTTATYSFQFTIAGSNGLFAFDPYIGDGDE